MSDRFIDWLFDTLISVDVQHQELLRGFGVLLLIPFALFLLSYVSVSFAFIKDRARKGTLGTVTRVLAAELGPRNIRVNSIAPGSVETEGLHATGESMAAGILHPRPRPNPAATSYAEINKCVSSSVT